VVHFALDEHEVRFCTHLKGKESWFLPLNKGWNDGAGNPPDLLPFGICECLFTAHRINQFFKMGLLDDIPVASIPPDEKQETDEAVF